MAQDVRAVANVVLREARRNGLSVSNLALNKIIYFLHASFLHEFGRPLVTAKIEAWDHGPVFREVYHQFKKFGREDIEEPARRLNPVSGEFEEVVDSLTKSESAFVRQRCLELLKIAPGKLVDMSHVKDGPWHRVRFGTGSVNPGMEISDKLILELAAEQARH